MPRTKKISNPQRKSSVGKTKQSNGKSCSHKQTRRPKEPSSKPDADAGLSGQRDCARSGSKNKSSRPSTAHVSKAGVRPRGLRKDAASKSRAILNGQKRRRPRRRSKAFESSGDDSDSSSVEVVPSAHSAPPSEKRGDHLASSSAPDHWYEDYYTSEVNVADDTLLDILVETIKRHYEEDSCESSSASSPAANKGTSSGWRRERHTTAGRAVEEELRSLTNNALLVKKAWAFVTEDAAYTRKKKSCLHAQKREELGEGAQQAEVTQGASPAEGEHEANVIRDGEKDRDDADVSLRHRWDQFVSQRKGRLEIEGRVRKECEAAEVAGQPRRKEAHEQRGQSSCAAQGAEKRREPVSYEQRSSPLAEGGEDTSLSTSTRLNGDTSLASDGTSGPPGRSEIAVQAPVQARDNDQCSSASPGSVFNSSATTLFSSPYTSGDQRGGFASSQALLAADDAVSFHHVVRGPDDVSEEEIAETFLFKVTKSPSAGSSSPCYSPSSSSSSDESSYSPTSSESDEENSSEEGETETHERGLLQGAFPEGAAASLSEDIVGGVQPGSTVSNDGASEAAVTTEAGSAAAEVATWKKRSRRMKNKVEKPSKKRKRNKSMRVKGKKRHSSQAGHGIPRNADWKAGGSLLDSGKHSACTTFSSWSQLSSSSKRIKGIHVPKSLALRPQCIYFFESTWEKEMHTRYPNGMLRRGTVCVDLVPRVDETLEFFLFCRFLNLFASVVDVAWTFQDLIEGFSSNPSAVSSTVDTDTSSIYPSGESGRNPAGAGGGSTAGGIREEGRINSALRKIITKLFHFLGRRITPGMSLTRMCGRYVEDKRREGVLPAGLLWPFDYPVKVWQPLESVGKGDSSKKKKREHSCGTEGDSENSRDRQSALENEAKKSDGHAGEIGKEEVGKRQSDDPGNLLLDGVEGVLLESCYNPFKVCDDWQQLKSVHKLRVVRLLMEQALSESPHFIKAMKSKSEESLQSGFEGPDALGRLYWIVPQCGDITVFKLYREDPKNQKLEILCEDIAALESVAEALSMDEGTTMVTSALFSVHQQMLLHEKQKSRELRRQKALNRQLEISNWGCVPLAGQKRDRKPVDYTFAAYDASIEGRGGSARAAGLSSASHPETQRQDRSERLKARQAKKEELETVTAVAAMEKNRDDRTGEDQQPSQADGLTQVPDGAADNAVPSSRSSAVVGDSDNQLVSQNAFSGPRKRQYSRATARADFETDIVANEDHEFLAAQQERVRAVMQPRAQQDDNFSAVQRGQQFRQHEAMLSGQSSAGVVNTQGLSSVGQISFQQLPLQAPAQQYRQPLQAPAVPVQRLSPIDVAAMQQQLLQVREALTRSTLSPAQKEEAYRNVWLHLSNKYMGLSSNGYSVPGSTVSQVPQSTAQTNPAAGLRPGSRGLLSMASRAPLATSQQATAAVRQGPEQPNTVFSQSLRSPGQLQFDTRSHLQVHPGVDHGGAWGVQGQIHQHVAAPSAFQGLDSQVQPQQARPHHGGEGQHSQQQWPVQQQQLPLQGQLLDLRGRQNHLRTQQTLLGQGRGALR